MKYLSMVLFSLLCALEPASSQTPGPESRFVNHASSVLLSHYPTTAQAVAHGYVKMRELDKDNTTIYTNFQYRNVSTGRPNFLWYDRSGKLVGVDYEFSVSIWRDPPIARYPAARSRWVIIPEHVHFAYTFHGKTVRHGRPALANLKRGTITLAELQADTLVPHGATLLWASYHPKSWDLGFWVVPNPAGPFAEKNSLVK